MRTRTRTLLGALVCAAVALATPSGAAATTTTIGSTLLNEPASVQGGGATTYVQTELFANQLTAPYDGVVVRWRIKTKPGPQASFRLRVVRPFDATRFQGAGSSSTRTNSAAGGIETFPTRLPVLKDDYLGVTLSGNAIWRLTGHGGNASDMTFDSLMDGEASEPANVNPDEGVEFFYNADVETDGDEDGFGDDTQDNCPTVFNPFQVNSDGAPDGGNACDPNDDNDARPDAQDNCPVTASPSQADFDRDGRGDPCDPPKPGRCANPFRGTPKGETTAGSAYGDVIRGLRGADALKGRRGADCLYGGRGADELRGGPGADLLSGGRGPDVLRDPTGRNFFDAGKGDDRIFARNTPPKAEFIRCGEDEDLAVVDAKDTVDGCETVLRP